MKPEITKKRALEVVKSAPGELGQEYIAEHVQKHMQDAYDEGKRAGALEARETVLREQLAFYEGIANQFGGRANEARKELKALLDALGKICA